MSGQVFLASCLYCLQRSLLSVVDVDKLRFCFCSVALACCLASLVTEGMRSPGIRASEQDTKAELEQTA